MTDKEWHEQVDRALAAAGLPWRVTSAWVEQAGTVLCAELVDMRSGQDRTIRLSGVVFRTEAERQNEMLRQLEERGRR